MTYEVIDSFWYTGFQFNGQCIGFVAIKSGPGEGDWKCYVGILDDPSDEVEDPQTICANGAKVTREVACAHFPHLDPDKYKF